MGTGIHPEKLVSLSPGWIYIWPLSHRLRLDDNIVSRIESLERRLSLLERELSSLKPSIKSQLSSETLILSKESILRSNLDKAKRLFVITEEGDVVFNAYTGSLNTWEKIVLYLIGKTYSKMLGYSDIDEVTNRELATKVGIPYNSTKGAAMNNLRKERVIVTHDGRHKIEYSKIPQLLETLIQKIEN